MKKTNMLLLGAMIFTALPAVAESATAAEEVMATTKAEWAAERAKKLPESMSYYADDYTELNSEAGTRLDGKELSGRLMDAANKDSAKGLSDEMLNPKVQVYGDTAILSYNYYGQALSKEGEVKAIRAKSTRVYVKQGGAWKLVHGHFTAEPTPK